MAEIGTGRSGDTVTGTCLLVLGMHRSGTSAFTRMLSLLGAALPPQLLTSAADNPTGFWEGRTYLDLHDECLAAARLGWIDPAPVRPAFFASDKATALSEKLARLVTADFRDAPLYAVKDPRACRLVPIWRQALSAIGTRLVPLLVIRNPYEVAESLQARNGLPVPAGLLLWLRHVLEAEAATRDLGRSIILYDRFLEDWRATAATISERHGIPWPSLNAETEAKISRFLRPDLHHYHAPTDPWTESELEEAWVMPAYRALVDAADNAALDTATLDRVRREIERTDRIYGLPRHLAEVAAEFTRPDLDELIAGLDRAKEEIGNLRERVKRANDQTGRAYSELATLAAEAQADRQVWQARYNSLAETHNALTNRYNDLTEQHTGLANRHNELAHRHNELAHRHNALADRYNLVLESTSWKLTQPIRGVLHRLKGGEEAEPASRTSADAIYISADAGPILGTIGLDDGRLADPTWRATLTSLELIAWSGLLDPAYYAATYPETAGSGDLLKHFIETGAAAGYDPNPWFDTAYYSTNNLRLKESGENPLVDYIRQGAWDGPDPHPNFRTDRYLDLHPELQARHLTPLSHFMRYELPAAAPPAFAGAPVDHPRALHALAPLDPGPGWLWQRLLIAGALVPRRGCEADGEAEFFGDPARPKLLFASHELSRTGAPLVLLNLIKRFAADTDAEIFVFSDRGGALLDEFSASAHVLLADRYLPFSAGGGISDIATIIEKLAGAKPVGAYCNTASTEHYGRCFRRFGIPVVFLVHEIATSYGETDIQRLFEVADEVVAVSEFARQSLLDKIGPIAERTRVVPAGLLKPELLSGETGEAHASLRRDLGLPATASIVLTCGTMDLRKGVDIFFQTARRVIQSTEDVYFIWVGSGAIDRALPAWWAQHDAMRVDCGDHIRFVGERLDTESWFLGADVFLLTSREDPMPCVVIEAMAAGLPVIVFDGGGGAPEAVAGTGVIVNYLDSDAMADATIGLLADPERRRQLGEAARQRVRDLYGFDTYFETIRSLIPALETVPGTR